jgi:predicted dehydrogenase
MVAGTHLAAIRDTPEVILRGISARGPKRAKALLADWHGPIYYPDINDIADDPTVQAVIVVTPPDARADVIAPLAAAGKHILLEKPVARSLAEAKEVVAICDRAGVTLGIVFQHRMRAASLAARDLVASGRLGALGLAEITVPWWRDQGYYDEPGRGSYARDGGGVLISQAIHTIDLALSLAGPVAAVQAMTGTTRLHRMEAEDFACAGLRFANGAVGSLTASTASYPGAAEAIVLHFEHASLRLADGILTTTWRDGRVETHGAAATTGGGADPMAFTHDWHQAILADFCAAIRGGHAPAITGRDALRAHGLIDAITASSKAGHLIEVTL